jgi:hypothetical protein
MGCSQESWKSWNGLLIGSATQWKNYKKRKGFDMNFWTWHGSTISHIPTIGWAVVKDKEVVLVRESLFELFSSLEG